VDEEGRERIETGSEDDNRPEDGTISDEKTCPRCGAPVENLRKTCPQCGYEYEKDDYSDREAGDEFVAGSEVDDEGNEVVEEEDDTDDTDDPGESSSSRSGDD
jgi:hypothetical protein